MRTLPFLGLILENKKKILEGTMLAIDPSVGSSSSMPGWALYEKGKLVSSGTIEIKASLPLQKRLFELTDLLLTEFAPVDILAVEYITQFGRLKVDSLLKSVGAIMAGVRCAVCVEIPPSTWHLTEPEGYVKGDEQDAIAIGHYVLQEALTNGKAGLVRREEKKNIRLLSRAPRAPRRTKRDAPSARTKLGRKRRASSRTANSVRKVRD